MGGKGGSALVMLLLLLATQLAVLPVQAARAGKLGNGEPAAELHTSTTGFSALKTKAAGFQAAACAILGLSCNREALSCLDDWYFCDYDSECCSGRCIYRFEVGSCG